MIMFFSQFQLILRIVEIGSYPLSSIQNEEFMKLLLHINWFYCLTLKHLKCPKGMSRMALSSSDSSKGEILILQSTVNDVFPIISLSLTLS